MEEIDRSVKRVDDPASTTRAGVAAAFLGQSRVVGPVVLEHLEYGGFSRSVDVAHWIDDTLELLGDRAPESAPDDVGACRGGSDRQFSVGQGSVVHRCDGTDSPAQIACFAIRLTGVVVPRPVGSTAGCELLAAGSSRQAIQSPAMNESMTRMLGAAGAGLLVMLGFPPYEWTVPSWIGTIVFVWLLSTAPSLRHARWSAYVFGLAFFGTLLWWLSAVELLAFYPMIMLQALPLLLVAGGVYRYRDSSAPRSSLQWPARWVLPSTCAFGGRMEVSRGGRLV